MGFGDSPYFSAQLLALNATFALHDGFPLRSSGPLLIGGSTYVCVLPAMGSIRARPQGANRSIQEQRKPDSESLTACFCFDGRTQ